MRFVGHVCGHRCFAGNYQIIRDGSGYLYNFGSLPNDVGDETTNPNPGSYVILAVGSTVVWPSSTYLNYRGNPGADITATTWASIVTTVTDPNVAFTSVLTTPVIQGLTYTVTLSVSYRFPFEHVTMDASVSIPPSNAEIVRLYYQADSFLGGDDLGPGFHKDSYAVGVQSKANVLPADAIALGFVNTAGVAWSGYQSATFYCNNWAEVNHLCNDNSAQGFGPGYATNFANYIEASENIDNGFGFSKCGGCSPCLFTLRQVQLFM